jgi:hypothetical protein
VIIVWHHRAALVSLLWSHRIAENALRTAQIFTRQSFDETKLWQERRPLTEILAKVVQLQNPAETLATEITWDRLAAAPHWMVTHRDHDMRRADHLE